MLLEASLSHSMVSSLWVLAGDKHKEVQKRFCVKLEEGGKNQKNFFVGYIHHWAVMRASLLHMDKHWDFPDCTPTPSPQVFTLFPQHK